MKHGSYLRFGCLEFVFSVMDYTGDEEQDNSAIYNLSLAFQKRKQQKSNASSKAPSVKEENDDSTEMKDEPPSLEPKDEVVPMDEDSSSENKS